MFKYLEVMRQNDSSFQRFLKILITVWREGEERKEGKTEIEIEIEIKIKREMVDWSKVVVMKVIKEPIGVLIVRMQNSVLRGKACRVYSYTMTLRTTLFDIIINL